MHATIFVFAKHKKTSEQKKRHERQSDFVLLINFSPIKVKLIS